MLSDLVKDIKSSSSKWVNANAFIKGKFQWQEGFGSFSVSQSHVSNVIAYIDNQEKHHHQSSFREEYLKLLRSYKIGYNEKYVFDWIEEGVTPKELQ